MKLIADCGATKSTWAAIHNDAPTRIVNTSGINAMHMTEDEISGIIVRELLPEMSDAGNVSEIYFYGAGIVDNHIKRHVAAALQGVFKDAIAEVDTDLMGAARALCGHQPGIACILGTGSNSCYYDGDAILANVSPLGYILGDEGSGAVLGKKLIADVLKHQLPADISLKFLTQYDVDYSTLIKRIYRKPGANKFMAGFVPFLRENIDVTEVRSLVVDAFIEFFKRNIAQYPDATTLPVNFVGSVAYYFSPQLAEAATATGFKIGKVEKKPIAGLVAFHSNPA